MRLLLTRPEPDASAMKPALEAIGCDVVIEPLLSVDFPRCEDLSFKGVQALIATSRNGLRALTVGQLGSGDAQAGKYDTSKLETARKLPLFVVGKGTQALAKELGFIKLYLGAGTADALPDLIAQKMSPERGEIVHLAGADLAANLNTPLSDAGFSLRSPVVYKAKQLEAFSPATLKLFQSGEIDSVLLMSPRTVDTYADIIHKSQLTEAALKMTYFCLSERIAERLERLGTTFKEISLKPNTQEMLALIANTVAKMR